MATKARVDGDYTKSRERILAAARRLFAEQGYTAASISKIAKEAGVLAGSIYWAFESKEKLFAAALTAAADEWKHRYQPAAGSMRLPLSEVRDRVIETAAGFAEAPEFLRLLMVVATEHQASSPEILAAAVAVRRTWRDALEAALLAEMGDYEAEGARILVQRIGRLILQLLDGVFMSLQIEQDELAPDELLADSASVIQRELDFGIAQLRKRD